MYIYIVNRMHYGVFGKRNCFYGNVVCNLSNPIRKELE